MTTNWQISLQGAYATPDLVGREEILKQVMERIEDQQNPRSCIIFLSGAGGIGKTRLLTEIINQCKRLPGIKACDRLIDVYHLLYHTPYEMTQAIYESLKPLPEPFRLYERDARVLERLRLSGEAVEIEEQRDQALQSFIKDLKLHAARHRVVILLDTIERFVYGTAEQPTGMYEVADAWEWLIKELDNLTNVVFVAAGRPQSEALFKDISDTSEILPFTVGEFSEEESKQYFDAAARMARQNKAEEVAIRLESLSLEEREQSYRLTNGRPIFLALLADYVSSGGLLRPLFEEVLAGLEKTLQERFQDKILTRLLNMPRLGEVLRCMVLMTKGVDVELLSAAMAVPSAEAREHLRGIERLSFVKVRRFYQKQQKDAYFLHDELYELLQKVAFVGHHGYDEKHRIYVRVIERYEDRFRIVRRKLAELYSVVQAGGKDEIDYEALNDSLAQRTEILLTLLNYRLREAPAKGYRRWFRYDHEATISGDLVFSIQLQLELLTYLRELPKAGIQDAPGWDLDFIQWALLILPVKRAWAKQDFKTVLDEARKIEDTMRSELTNPVKKALLSIWKAYALIASNPSSAHNELDQVSPGLEAYYRAQTDAALRWQAQALLAFVYRVRGYAYRVQELVEPAIQYYRQAAVLLREVDLKVEMATVNNDLGFALALHGEWADARSLVENALEMRGDLGLGMQVASSLNTLAIIDTYEGRYQEAIENATKSLNLSRAVEHKRRAGMARVALAEATRRLSATLSGAEVQSRIDLLNRAYEMADAALSVFEEIGEKSRKVEALIEKGCARRDAIRLARKFKASLYSEDKWIKESQQVLEEAARTASELVQKPRVHYRQVDALVNLAWLGYYAGGEQGESIQKDAETQAYALLNGYDLVDGQPKPEMFDKPEYQPLLSTQLGKLYVLRGHQTYAQNPEMWKERDPENAGDLVKDVYKTLAREYFLGLEHSALYSQEYRDLRLAKQQIFDNIKVLRPQNLRLFLGYLKELEDCHRIENSELRQLLVKRALSTE